MQIPFRAAACAALLVSSQGAIGAPKEIRTPPVGETHSTEVMRGGRRSITLKAYEGRNNPLTYEIVRKPSHGALLDFRQADENRQGFASIVYAHDNDEVSASDEFAFRARAAAGGVSSPIAVKIRILDEPPRLAAPARVNFSAFAGESEIKTISLTNEGGSTLEGRLAPEAPFYVEGDGSFSLGRGESTNLSVRFSPRSTATVIPQKVTPSRADPAATITFEAEAEAPFAADAQNMVLDTKDGSREGAILLTNFCPAGLKLLLEVQPRGAAEIPREIRVAAGKHARIPVRIGPDKKSGPVEMSVRASNDFYSLELPLAAPAVPPRLEVLSEEVDFREGNETVLTVGNAGGVAGRFALTLPEGIKSADGAESFSVQPGAETRVELLWDGAGCGERITVTLQPGGEENIEVLLPSLLKVLTPRLDFRRENIAELLIRNEGGTEGSFKLDLPPWLKVEEPRTSFVVPPKATTPIVIGLSGGGEEKESAPLVVRFERGENAHVEVLRKTHRGTAPDRPPDPPRGGATITGAGFGGFPVKVAAQKTEKQDIIVTVALPQQPGSGKFSIEEVTGLLESDDASRPPRGYTTRRMSPTEAKVVPSGKVRSGDLTLDLLDLRFADKARGPSLLCRLVSEGGGPSSDVFSVRCEPRQPWSARPYLGLAAVALGAFLVYGFFQRRRIPS